MVHAARASVNRAAARLILRSGSAASKGSSTAAPSTRQFLIGRSAIRIARNSPENNALNFTNRPTIGCSEAQFTAHNSPITSQESAIVSSHPLFLSLLIGGPLLEIELAHSQQTRKHFLIGGFFASSAPAPHRTNPDSRIAPFLFDTNERARKKANLFTTNKKQFLRDTFQCFIGFLFDTFERSSIYPFLPPTRHGRIAAL